MSPLPSNRLRVLVHHGRSRPDQRQKHLVMKSQSAGISLVSNSCVFLDCLEYHDNVLFFVDTAVDVTKTKQRPLLSRRVEPGDHLLSAADKAAINQAESKARVLAAAANRKVGFDVPAWC